MNGLEVTKNKDIFKVTSLPEALKSCADHDYIGVVIHHADYFTKDDRQLVFDISDWHTFSSPKGRGWGMIGYAAVVERDGTIYLTNRLITGIQQAQAIGKIDGRAANECTIGICLSLDGVKQEPTSTQEAAVCKLIYEIAKRYKSVRHGYVFSHAVVQGDKNCPGWKVQTRFGLLNQFLDDGIAHREG